MYLFVVETLLTISLSSSFLLSPFLKKIPTPFLLRNKGGSTYIFLFIDVWYL